MNIRSQHFSVPALPSVLLTLGLSVGIAFIVFPAHGQCITPLGTWQVQNSLSSTGSYDPQANDGDPDGDGVKNILEWAFNLPPRSAGRPQLAPGSGTNGLPLIIHTPGNPTNAFTVEYLRSLDATASSVTYRVETANSLDGPWIAATNGQIATPIPGIRYERVLAHVQLLAPGAARQFCRVAVTMGRVYCPTSIYQIRNGSIPAGSSVRVTDALISGVFADGFHVQVKEGDPGYTGFGYSGLFVHTGTGSPWLHGLMAGHRVTVDGVVVSDGAIAVLNEVVAVTSTRIGEAAPTPILVSAADIVLNSPQASSLASLIVQLRNCTTVSTGAGEFTVSDGSASILIGESLFTLVPAPVAGQPFMSITGVNTLHGGVPRLEPRAAADIVQ